KIWAQSALPFFSMLFLVGWLRRDRRWGAFLWGLLSAVIGQIHMSGFFFAAAFVLWELFAGRERREPPNTRWRLFVAGCLVGALGLVPWVVALARFAVATVAGAASPTMNAAASSAAAASTATGDGWLTTLARWTDWGSWVDFHVLSLWPSYWLNWMFD